MPTNEEADPMTEYCIRCVVKRADEPAPPLPKDYYCARHREEIERARERQVGRG